MIAPITGRIEIGPISARIEGRMMRLEQLPISYREGSTGCGFCYDRLGGEIVAPWKREKPELAVELGRRGLPWLYERQLLDDSWIRPRYELLPR